MATRAPTGQTAAYLVGQSNSLLVDPAAWTEQLAAAAREADVGHVAVTHHHPDHVGGVADAAAALDCTVWARAGRVSAFEAATGVVPDRTFGADTIIPAASGVSVLDTPGHAAEHVGFVCGDEIVSGDVAVAEGSVVVGAPDGEMRAYLSTLRRLHARNPGRLHPAHGPVIDRPRDVCRRLIQHRIDRERAVARAVSDGARTIGEIVDAAYEKDISTVRDLARATVVAHVEKLVVENRLARDGHRVLPA